MSELDIFSAIEEAGDEIKEERIIDLGPISRLVEKQAMLEGPVDISMEDRLSRFIQKENVSVATIEECLRNRKKDLYKVRQQQIPEIMKSFELDAITTTSGTEIKIIGDISITRKSDEKLFDYLRSNDAGDLIKNKIIVSVDNEAERRYLAKKLEEEDCIFESKEDIHSGTLKKYLKELKKEGKAVPEDAVSVFDYEYSKIKKGKKK
jgi:hypothetical protein